MHNTHTLVRSTHSFSTLHVCDVLDLYKIMMWMSNGTGAHHGHSTAKERHVSGNEKGEKDDEEDEEEDEKDKVEEEDEDKDRRRRRGRHALAAGDLAMSGERPPLRRSEASYQGLG